MKKSILSLLLVVVLTFGATQSVISAFAETKRNDDTPIAQIANDDYVPYNYEKKTAPENNVENLINNVTDQVKAVGGHLETYSSEQDYLNAQKSTTEKVTNELGYNLEPEEVKQTIKVMTTATGTVANNNYVKSKPVSNAIVRINGVPRYTDRAGEIKVTLEKGYVELFVEKEGYNPYIEIMEVTGEEKVVHIKQPNDDIDIYAVMLDYAGLEFNVLTQSCFINEEIEDSYYSELTILSNVPAEEYYLLRNNEIFRYSSTGTFYDLKFDTLVPGDSISVQVVYNGISSKIVDTLITIETFADIDTNNATRRSSNEEGDLALDFGGNDLGIFDGFNMNLLAFVTGSNPLTEFLKKDQSDHSVNFKVNYNKRTGVLSVTVGYTYDKFFENEKDGKDDLTDLGRYVMATELIDENNKNQASLNKQIDDLSNDLSKNEARLAELIERNKDDREGIEKLKSQKKGIQKKIDDISKNKEKSAKYFRQQQKIKQKEIDKAQKSINDRNKVVRDLVDQVNNKQISLMDCKEKLSTIKDFAKSTKKLYNQSARGVIFQFEALGVFDYNVRDNVVENINITGSVSVGYKWSGTFMVWVIPCFYEVSATLKLSVTLNFDKSDYGVITLNEVIQRILVDLSLTLRGEVGVGINDVISVSVYAKVTGGIQVYPLAIDENGDFYVLDLHHDEDEWVFNKYGVYFEWKIGVRAEFLFWDWEYFYGDRYENAPTEPLPTTIKGPDICAAEPQLLKRSAKVASSSYSLSMEEQEISSVYQGSKPQIVQYKDEYILTWISDEPTRDTYNRTVLKYSIYKDGEWSIPSSVYDDGKADFYFDTYADGEDLYITWQKTNRLLSDQDDFITAGCASEIYVAKFDFASQSFIEPVRLTNNYELDAAPKFALKENDSDPLMVVWQKNSDNNILGVTGENSIYYSRLNGSIWETPKKLYETEQYISFISSAIKNGKLVSAFEEEVDGDLTTQDRIIKIASEDRSQIELTEGLSNPQFELLNGAMSLFYYGDGLILFTQDFSQSFIFTAGITKDTIPQTFKLEKTENGIIISYIKVVEDKSVTYCAIYNQITGEWLYNIKLAEESLAVSNICSIIAADGQIISAYNIADEDNNVTMRVVDKYLKSDFEIESAFFDILAAIGDKTVLCINIKNTGDYDLKDFEIVIYGQTLELSLENPIVAGTNGYLKIDFVRSNDGFVNFSVIANGIQRDFELQTSYANVKLSGCVELENGSQKFNLTIVNDGELASDVILEVYKKDELVYSESFIIESNTDILRSLYIEDVAKNEPIYFTIKAKNDKILSDNSILLRSLIDDQTSIDITNPYEQILHLAKQNCGVIC